MLQATTDETVRKLARIKTINDLSTCLFGQNNREFFNNISWCDSKPCRGIGVGGNNFDCKLFVNRAALLTDFAHGHAAVGERIVEHHVVVGRTIDG